MGGYSTETNTYKRLRYLNALRKFLMSNKVQVPSDGKPFADDKGRVVLSTREDLVFSRGPVLVALNNVRCLLAQTQIGYGLTWLSFPYL